MYVSENSDYLQTSHHPPLHWRDHKNIDTIFKNGELLIKTLVHQIIKFRSKKRLIVTAFFVYLSILYEILSNFIS